MALADTMLSGADIPSAQPMRSAYLTLNVDSESEAERVFAGLSEGGRILMPMVETFFATRFGQVQRPLWHQLGGAARAPNAGRRVAGRGGAIVGAESD